MWIGCSVITPLDSTANVIVVSPADLGVITNKLFSKVAVAIVSLPMFFNVLVMLYAKLSLSVIFPAKFIFGFHH